MSGLQSIITPATSSSAVAGQSPLRPPVHAQDPDTSDSNLIDAGAQLRAAREHMGLSLADVNRDIRISRDQVAHMEAGAFEKLSCVPALRDGHVRSYALYLGVDLEPILNAVRTRTAGDSAATPEPLYPPPPRRNPFAYVLIGISLAILTILIMAWDRLSSVEAYLPPDGIAASEHLAPAASRHVYPARLINQSEFSE